MCMYLIVEGSDLMALFIHNVSTISYHRVGEKESEQEICESLAIQSMSVT